MRVMLSIEECFPSFYLKISAAINISVIYDKATRFEKLLLLALISDEIYQIFYLLVQSG